jgi:uncharacterized SAM-binding protein YcdF (DUF218 family)
MIFKKKKYLFPIEKEPSRFNIRVVMILLGTVYMTSLITMFSMLKGSSEQSKKTNDFFFNRSPDLIVVPTGDRGRISLAIDMAKKYKLSNIFITGVYKKNSLQNIIPKNIPQDLNINFFEIDYVASNTVENAILTLRYLRHHAEIKSALVISSDYHLPRIKMIFDQLTLPSDQFTIFYLGRESNYLKLQNLKKLHFELIKFLRNFLMLSLWTPEIEEV